MNPFKAKRKVKKKDKEKSVLGNTAMKGVFRWRRY